MPADCSGVGSCVMFKWRDADSKFRYNSGTWDPKTISACFPGNTDPTKPQLDRVGIYLVAKHENFTGLLVQASRSRTTRSWTSSRCPHRSVPRERTRERCGHRSVRPCGPAPTQVGRVPEGGGGLPHHPPRGPGDERLPLRRLAISVDTSRWYDEMGRVQKAADAAALAGVPFLPFDMTNATLRAKEVAKRNGYDDASPDVVVKVEKGLAVQPAQGDRLLADPQQLRRPHRFVEHHAHPHGTADYKGPAPMGSPCNTFGNEPDAGTGVSSPAPTDTALGTSCPRVYDCPTSGPGSRASARSKSNGDRYMNSYCATKYRTTSAPATTNNEYDPTAAQSTPGKRGYIWVVRVQQAAVGQPSGCSSTTRPTSTPVAPPAPACRPHPLSTTT